MKTLLAMVLLALLLPLTPALAEEGPTMEPPSPAALWGLSQAELAALIGAPAVNETGQLIRYEAASIYGLPAEVTYLFDTQDQCNGVTYHIDAAGEGPNGPLDGFSRLVAGLTDAYGPPIVSGQTWHSALLKGDRPGHGLAAGIGHLTQEAAFADADTTARVLLYGQDGAARLTLAFQSK